MSRSECDPPVRLPMPTRADRIRSAIRAMEGWGYAKSDVQYPWSIPGVDVHVVDKYGSTNCCCFVEAVIVRAYDVQEWGPRRHADSMIMDIKRPFSSVDVLQDAGLTIATENTGPLGRTRWYAVQGWRGGMMDIPQCGGHTFLVETTPGEPMVTMHDANVSTGVHQTATTWRTIHRRYPSNRIVRLRDD